MITHVLPRMACVCAMLVVVLTHCGCISFKGPSGWASAWNSKPKPTNPNDREVVTYWGQKKKEAKPLDKEELRNQMAQGTEESRQSSFENHLRIGNQALRDNRLDEARREYQRALELRPNDPDCHHRLAVVADKEGQFGLADDHYEAALKLRPRDANLLSDMGYSYSLRGDDRRAESTLNQALSISPSNKGALGNLGAIYSRQGRYEEALAMLRRGTSEAETQFYLAKWFPNRQDAPINNIAQNSQTNPPSSNNNNIADGSRMNVEELRRLMDQERAKGQLQRQQKIEAEGRAAQSAVQTAWMDDNPQRTQTNNGGTSNQPFVMGPGGNQPHNSMPIVTPNGGNGMPPVNQNNPQPGMAAPNNSQGQVAQNGASNPGGEFRAPPGTTPQIPVWSGGPGTVDQAGGTEISFDRRNAPQQQPAAPPGQANNPFARVNLYNSQPPAANTQQPVDSNAVSANFAAAQLGMNVGPGGLFPVAPADANSNGQAGFGSPNIQNRMSHEYPSPPQFQSPPTQFQNQFPPGNNGFGDPRPGAGSTTRASYNGFNENTPLSPPSPTSNWAQPGPSGNQTGATLPSNPSTPRIGTDPFERFPSASDSTWADKPSLGGAAPYNGAWPPSSPANPAASNGGAPNSLPVWNGGQPDNRPQPRQYSNVSATYPEQWPHSTR